LPNERVFAVQYRKVRFNFLGKPDMEDGVLEKGNRWEQLTRFKGMEMNDVIEVSLGGDNDLEDEDEDERKYLWMGLIRTFSVLRRMGRMLIFIAYAVSRRFRENRNEGS
jgi:hypothetical protein